MKHKLIIGLLLLGFGAVSIGATVVYACSGNFTQYTWWNGFGWDTACTPVNNPNWSGATNYYYSNSNPVYYANSYTYTYPAAYTYNSYTYSNSYPYSYTNYYPYQSYVYSNYYPSYGSYGYACPYGCWQGYSW